MTIGDLWRAQQESWLQERLRQARAEERASCCRAICPACAAGYPALSRPGGWVHVWTRLDGSEETAACRAAEIREAGQEEETL